MGLSLMLKPRENGCALSLWVAERVAERRLLNDDGIAMGEDTWLVGARFGVRNTGGAHKSCEFQPESNA